MKKSIFLLIFLLGGFAFGQTIPGLEGLGIRTNRTDVSIYDGNLLSEGRMYQGLTITTDTTAGAKTWTAAQILGGYLLRDPNGGARSDVFPTAATIIDAIPFREVGTSFMFMIKNTANASETITMTAGAGISITGTATIAQNNTKIFLARVASIGATDSVAIYSIGTLTH